MMPRKSDADFQKDASIYIENLDTFLRNKRLESYNAFTEDMTDQLKSIKTLKVKNDPTGTDILSIVSLPWNRYVYLHEIHSSNTLDKEKFIEAVHAMEVLYNQYMKDYTEWNALQYIKYDLRFTAYKDSTVDNAKQKVTLAIDDFTKSIEEKSKKKKEEELQLYSMAEEGFASARASINALTTEIVQLNTEKDGMVKMLNDIT